MASFSPEVNENNYLGSGTQLPIRNLYTVHFGSSTLI